MNDWRLIQKYVREGAEDAFTQLAARHLGLVYSTCLRETGDVLLAEDAAQVVFLLLARKARRLRRETNLAGWLFHTSRLVAKNLVRQRRRRTTAEQAFVQEKALQAEHEQGAWEAVEPRLHDALDRLRPAERAALLLRFFEECSYEEVGTALGIPEDAARMRVNRALEKMRRTLAQTGTAISAGGLAVLLSERALREVPPSCASMLPKIAAAGLAGPVAAISAGWHVIPFAQAIARAGWKANLKIAAALLGIGAATTGTLPLIHHFAPLRQAHGTISVAGPTKSQAAQSLMSELSLEKQNAQLGVLMQPPGAAMKLNRAMQANPMLFAPRSTIFVEGPHAARDLNRMRRTDPQLFALHPDVIVNRRALTMRQALLAHPQAFPYVHAAVVRLRSGRTMTSFAFSPNDAERMTAENTRRMETALQPSAAAREAAVRQAGRGFASTVYSAQLSYGMGPKPKVLHFTGSPPQLLERMRLLMQPGAARKLGLSAKPRKRRTF